MKLTERDKEKLIDKALDGELDLPGERMEILSRAVTYIGRADDVATIAELAGLLATGPVTSAATSGLAFASAVLFPVSALISVINAYETGQRMYGMRAVGYTLTAWSFSDPIPARSAHIIRNLTHGINAQSRHEITRYHQAWRRASERTLSHVNGLVADYEIHPASLKILYKTVGNGNRVELARMVLRSFESELPAAARPVWRANYSIRYPS